MVPQTTLSCVVRWKPHVDCSFQQKDLCSLSIAESTLAARAAAAVASGQSSSDPEGFYTLTSRVFDLYHRLLLPYGSHSRRFEGDSPSIK